MEPPPSRARMRSCTGAQRPLCQHQATTRKRVPRPSPSRSRCELSMALSLHVPVQRPLCQQSCQRLTPLAKTGFREHSKVTVICSKFTISYLLTARERQRPLFQNGLIGLNGSSSSNGLTRLITFTIQHHNNLSLQYDLVFLVEDR